MVGKEEFLSTKGSQNATKGLQRIFILANAAARGNYKRCNTHRGLRGEIPPARAAGGSGWCPEAARRRHDTALLLPNRVSPSP